MILYFVSCLYYIYVLLDFSIFLCLILNYVYYIMIQILNIELFYIELFYIIIIIFDLILYSYYIYLILYYCI